MNISEKYIAIFHGSGKFSCRLKNVPLSLDEQPCKTEKANSAAKNKVTAKNKDFGKILIARLSQLITINHAEKDFPAFPGRLYCRAHARR